MEDISHNIYSITLDGLFGAQTYKLFAELGTFGIF